MQKETFCKVTLYCGDCMELMAGLDDKEFDLAVVDPPYGIDVTKMNMGGRKTVKPDKSKKWDAGVPDEHYFKYLFAVSKNQVIWGGNYFDLPPSQYFAVWDKGETMYGRDFAECELAWVRKGGTRIHKQSPVDRFRFHPTQKPIKLYDWIMSNYAKPEHRILDTHLGSASSAIAAYYFGCEFVGIELDQEYFDAACKRVEQATKQESLF